VIALAGRRIDAAEAAEPRFPPSARARVKRELKRLFRRLEATALVCSAACGADLLALEAAGELGLRRRVVLPFGARRFRATSVVDRPGDWGPLYDAVIAEVRRRRDLVVLRAGSGDAAYALATQRILDECVRLSRRAHARALAVAVWEGQARKSGADATADFLTRAQEAGLSTHTIASRD